MKKHEFVDAYLQAVGFESKKKASEAVESFLDIILKELGKGGEVAFPGFGTFKVVDRKARMGINPKTGEKIQIAASKKPKFRAGKLFKEAVK
jgi:DNA-binding protein HU-beta